MAEFGPVTQEDPYEQSVATLQGVGPRMEERLRRLGLTTLRDLLFHLPIRYEDRTRITPIISITEGRSCVIEGEVFDSHIEIGRRRSLLVMLRDATGQIGLRFYTFNKAQQERLTHGSRWRCFGEARQGRTGLEIYHPEMRWIDPREPAPLPTCLTPVYAVVEGVPQRRMQSLVAQVLGLLESHPLPEVLPTDLLERWRFPAPSLALRILHQPRPGLPPESVEQGVLARDRLVYEELLAHHLGLVRLRRQLQAQMALGCRTQPRLEWQFRQHLGFALTAAQERVLAEIRADIARPSPMLRLLQGDVGSGKTVVAALTCLTAVSGGGQCVLMAPTEILAEQHLASMTRWFAPLGLAVAWVGGRQKSRERQMALAAIATGEAKIVVGTHALFQEGVVFQRLVLVVVDEQHRFGVHQRLALQDKGRTGGFLPHQLIMTATPIPRTLAMTAYADLDVSLIDELPPGRTPVVTRAVADCRRDEVIERVGDVCRQGRQAYWVCTLIEESEVLQCQAAEATARHLAEQLPGLSTGLVHGRLSTAEKAEVMARFVANEVQLLVATTVIEVGVDVPNATLMVIENPERLGLAQLHQLRGRVGRGQHQSYCLLLYHPPLSITAKARLQTMRDSQDGFFIAEQDLRLRGPGELLGTRQTGLAQFRIADLQRDQQWLDAVRATASTFVDHAELVAILERRWLGQRVRYAKV